MASVSKVSVGVGGGGRGASWRERETLDLLRLWGEEKVQEALSSSHRNLDIFEKISREMRSLGHKRSAMECRTKTKGLRNEYKRALTQNSPATFPYYKQLERIVRQGAGPPAKREPGSPKGRFLQALSLEDSRCFTPMEPPGKGLGRMHPLWCL